MKGDHGQSGDEGSRGRAGERGESGERGDTGHVGERGAEGAEGAEGLRGLRGERGPSHWLPYVIMGVAVVIALLIFDRQLNRVDKLAEANEANVEAVRFGQFGGCVRDNINAAVISLSFSGAKPGPSRTPAKVAQGLRIVNLYPVLNCKASVGGPPVKLAPAQVKKYVAVVATGRAPIVKDGMVIGSRDSVLDGVKSFKDVGVKP